MTSLCPDVAAFTPLCILCWRHPDGEEQGSDAEAEEGAAESARQEQAQVPQGQDPAQGRGQSPQRSRYCLHREKKPSRCCLVYNLYKYMYI